MAKAKGERFAFLDVVRGLAVIWMIQVHVTNVVLDPSLRIGWFFDVLNISNGFVAPTFIFCAGAGLWIALSRKGEAYRTFGSDLFVYLRRLSYILVWAYSLHAPFYSLDRLLIASADELLPWLQIDVLQTIVFSSLAALTVYLVIGDLRRTTWVYGVLALTIMCCTWATGVWPKESPFPLLPWSSYLFAGAFITGLFMQSNDKGRIARWMFWVGLIGPFVIFLSKNIGPAMPWDDTWWRTSPGLHLFRISGTLMLLGLLFTQEQRMRTSKLGTMLQTIGNESLFMYVGHLLFVYGSMQSVISSIYGSSTLGYGGVAVVWIIVTAAFVALMMIWHTLKSKRPDLAQRILIIQLAWMVISFIVLPADFSFSRMLGLD
ncbi:MAG: DUF1624 domain-containing protein [Ignavibacteria bacterium]|nr:DUF1624 domain-containing protein [Ignavibacteria bacterium]MBK7184606.1 DUF1624 domain-containing protein [Ignavibacteria bacterium]